jgi:hypothetical protein
MTDNNNPFESIDNGEVYAEIWTPIIGFENYEISNKGNIWSNKRNRFLKPQTITSNGRKYEQIGLMKDGKGYKKLVHVLMAESFNLPKTHENQTTVDHKNIESLDNRLENLQWASHSEQQMNKNMQKNNTSGFQGTCWDKNAKKWKASYRKDGKRHHIGLFDNAEEAYKAYLNKVIETHGHHCSQKLKDDFATYFNQ